MLNRAILAIGTLIVLLSPTFAAGDFISNCVDAAVPKAAITARNGKWIELTSEQWQFLRGIYVVI